MAIIYTELPAIQGLHDSEILKQDITDPTSQMRKLRLRMGM